jgi:serine palmitoyltransferase
MTLSIHLLALTVYQYVASVLLGVVRDLLAFRFWTIEHEMAPLLSDWSSFYERRMYSRIRDCFNRIVSSSPSSWISLSDQGQQTWALNLASYNYLGFGGHDNVCTPSVLASLHSQGTSMCSHRSTAGTSPQLLELERAVAAFVGQPAALVCGMGFATNANIIPLLVGRGALIVSDELNHTSIAVGARLSGAKIITFRHNGLFNRS